MPEPTGRTAEGRAGGPGRSITLGGTAGIPAANPRTGTVYVPVHSSHIVDVINAAKCNANVTSDCRVVARAKVGNGPLAVTVDEKTDTIYVANGTRSPPGLCRS